MREAKRQIEPEIIKRRERETMLTEEAGRWRAECGRTGESLKPFYFIFIFIYPIRRRFGYSSLY